MNMILTPTYDITTYDKSFPGAEGVDHDGVEIEALTKHPEKITHQEILAQDVLYSTP